MSSLTTTCLGVSNGSAALAITRAFRANRDRCLPGAAPLRGTDPFSARPSSSQTKRTVKIGVGLPATLHLNCFSVAEASAGSDASRCLPPLSAHRYSVVSHANAGRADEQPTTPIPRNTTFSVPPGHMSADPSWSPWSRTVIPCSDGSGSFSFVCFF